MRARRTTSPSIWRLLAGIRPSWVARAVLAAITLYVLVWALTGAETVSVQPDSGNFQHWEFRNALRVEPGPEYVLVECGQPCYVISPSLSTLALDPEDHPYVSVVFESGSAFQDPRILLSNRSNPGRFSPRPALTGRDQILCDLSDRQQWNGLLPYQSTPERIGVSFTGKMLLKRIEARSRLAFVDYLYLLYRQLISVEPPAPSAINELSGVHLFGSSQAAIAAAIMTIGVLLVLSFDQGRNVRGISIGLACIVLFLYLPWGIYLSREFKTSIEHSCLKFDLFDEYASCYGEEFSSLTRVLFEKVPRGSKVHFIRQIFKDYETEANLPAFILRTRYDPREFGEADYYVGLGWPGIYDARGRSLRDPFTGKAVAVEPVYTNDRSFIVKAGK